ncbi:ribonuclease domain-containing protein [Streptomyces sp. NPDC005876]|jgi:ribonuclease T1|uniref:ribonuclease domain-containing protein n=1 Tax=unclassified Streptomyces TaxID=2593676 RepID=UPI0033E9E645
MRFPPRVTRLGAAVAVLGAVLAGGTVTASAGEASAAAVGSVCYGDLPSQAHDTLDLIERGGPFPYAQDGSVFRNREGVLPGRATGYYHEYTVITPGSPTRGARRIVTGEEYREDYYTADHYASFDLVDRTC